VSNENKETKKPPHKCGAVAIIGRPNAGKSTLLNRILGQKIAITSDKPQTTRNRVIGIHTAENLQVVLVDTPGIHFAKSRINRAMVTIAKDSLDQVEAVCLVVDAERARERWPKAADGVSPAVDHLAAVVDQAGDLPVCIALNKIDRLPKQALLPLMAGLHARLPKADIIPISALKGKGIRVLVEHWASVLPEGPRMFPEDQIMDGTERFLVSELIRVKVFRMTHQEIPYSTGVEIEQFTEEERPDGIPFIEIYAKIIVERKPQKGIIIGKGGSMLKRVGTAARKDIARLLGAKVHLNLHVSVVERWTEKPHILHEFGIE
jgi:GTP-binding protein Era